MIVDALGITIFAAVSVAFVLGGLIFGKILRPARPNQAKSDIYECGEPTIGSGWVQFDLRFYVVALVYVIFDVEIALLYPWSRVFKDATAPAFWDLLFFFAVLLVGYAYLWKFGYLDWVRATGKKPSALNRGPGNEDQGSERGITDR